MTVNGRRFVSGREFEALAAHAASTYLRYSFTKGSAQEVEFLVETLGIGPDSRVLDVGCGPGRHAGALRALGFSVVGIDIALPFLLAAGPGLWARADVRGAPFPSSCFDAVICLCQGGFGLLGGHGELAAMAEMARVVRPGGVVVISAFSSYFALRFLEEGDTFDADSGVNHERATVRDEAGVDATFDLWTTCFTPRELRLMAAATGLVVRDLWSVSPGAYAARPPDIDHPEWLMVATRSARALR